MSNLGYWRECISCALDECGATLSDEQVTYIAEAVEGAHDCYGMAFHQPESPLIGEVARLRKELRKERDKTGCRECAGSGRLRYNSGPWSVDTQCSACHGEGKVSP